MPQNGETNGQRNNRLTSWKEIADYLGCDARTCVRWEKHLGLPVHRMEGSKKSRVFAFRDEIDEWQRRKSRLLNQKADDSADSEGQAGGGGDGEAERGPGFGPGAMAGAPRRGRNEQKGSRTGRQRKYAALLAAAAVVVVAAAYLAILRPSAPGEPADFRIDHNDLVILDATGKDLWRYPTGIQNLADDRAYRTHFQTRNLGSGDPPRPYLIIKDIDSDGRCEVLFTVVTNDSYPNTQTGKLFCLDHRGEKRWEFEAGRPLQIGNTSFSGDFYLDGFDVTDLDGDGKMEAIVSAHQWNRFPTHLSILGAEGKLLGEYWNAGQFIDTVCVDLDGDGRKEILAVGTNNEYGQGVLVVFDSADVRGCSHQFEEEYTWRDIEPGSELYYVRIPRADAELADYYPLDDVSQILPSKKSREFSLWSSRSVLEYVFDFDLAIREVRNSHAYMLMHENARRAGKITSVLDADYFEALRQAVLYWDGERWVNTPTMNKKSRPLNPPD
jgi:hypothetical protein